jgi:hypothetical protein
LVAPNGTIFYGRDGGIYGDDNVIGAHMCARNANTMGICLLGNYHNTGVVASDTALSSIAAICTWKYFKEGIVLVDDSLLHPVVNPVGYLGRLAGHQEGCNPGYTSCPGDQLLEQMNFILQPKIQTAINNCISTGIQIEMNTKVAYPNPWNSGTLNFPTEGTISVYSISGAQMEITIVKEHKLQYLNPDLLPAGSYIICIREIQSSKYQHIIKTF